MKKIKLPFPNPKLFPNQTTGKHYGVISRLRKEAKETAHLLALEAGVQGANPDGRVIFEFHMPDRRRRDFDGMLSAIKPHIDAIAAVGRFDDSVFKRAMIFVSSAKIESEACVVVQILEHGDVIDMNKMGELWQ